MRMQAPMENLCMDEFTLVYITVAGKNGSLFPLSAFGSSFVNFALIFTMHAPL